MFGWYVDIYTATVKIPTNMSQMTLLDSGVPIVFSNGAAVPKYDGEAKPNPYDQIKNIYGDYVNYIYTPPATYFTQSRFDTLKEFFPSVRLSAVNAWKTTIVSSFSEVNLRPMFIYFKSNNKILSLSESISDYVVRVLYNDGGNIRSLGVCDATYFNFAASYQRGTRSFLVLTFPHLNGYSNVANWWKQPWQRVTVQQEDGGYPWYYNTNNPVTPTGGFLTFLNNLFTDTSPDFDYPPETPPENPYGPGGDSEPGTEPPGTFDDSSDAIPDSSLPTLSAANTGFTRIYNPTLAQVQDLARYLWTDETLIETIWNKIKQYFENPMDAIIGFNLVPVAVPNGGTKNFALMYIDTGVQMTAAASQFVDQDCGSVKLERYYGSALDQSPYTKVSCYLPYIGTVQLNTDEVMGATLQVKYRVDIVSGSCVAKILVDGNVLYQYSGHCAITIPISSSDFSSYVQAAINVAKIIGGVVSGGAAGGVISAVGAVSTTPLDQETAQVVTRSTNEQDDSNIPQHRGASGSGPSDSNSKISNTKASFSGLTPANIANTVGEIMSAKPIIEHSGSFSGNSGYLGVRRPFLIIERPNMCMPKSYQTMNGFPAMITMKLGDCKGYTRVQQVQLTGMSATNPEQAEILNLLKMGVLL